MCASSDGSREPTHKRTLCRKDVILWVYELRYRHLSHMLCHYVQLFSGIHAHLFCSMQSNACATACLSSEAGTHKSVFVRASVYMHRLSLCALRHNNGSDVCASSECPGVRLCICLGLPELSMFA